MRPLLNSAQHAHDIPAREGRARALDELTGGGARERSPQPCARGCSTSRDHFHAAGIALVAFTQPAIGIGIKARQGYTLSPLMHHGLTATAPAVSVIARTIPGPPGG